jgi:hypothetical protein
MEREMIRSDDVEALNNKIFEQKILQEKLQNINAGLIDILEAVNINDPFAINDATGQELQEIKEGLGIE